MKKGILAAASVALSACMLAAFAGCGTVSTAKNMKGEEVTEDVWNTAMAGTVYEADASAANAVQTLSEVTAEQEASNYKVEYESKINAEMSSEGGNIGDQQIEAANLKIDMTSSSTVTVADNALHITLKYDFRFDGSENLLELMGIPEGLDGKGEVELYISFADGVAFYVKDGDGNWVSASADSTLISTAAQMVSEECLSLMDQSALVGLFSQYEYSSEHKGYVALDTDVSGSMGDSSLGATTTLVYKMRDNRLAAIYSSGDMDMNALGMSVNGTMETGLVYTYGGQSVTLPTVA